MLELCHPIKMPLPLSLMLNNPYLNKGLRNKSKERKEIQRKMEK